MPQQWIITVDDDHLDGIETVVSELESMGLVVEHVLRSLGQITGHTDDGEESPSPQRLSSVAGVASADGAQRHTIPPPDAEVQ